MKILQLCNKTPYPAKDGGALAILNMAAGLAELGNEISIFAINTKKHRTSRDEIPVELKNRIRFHFVDINTDISAWRLFKNLLLSPYPYNAERFISVEFRRKLIQLLESEYFDVIQLEGPYLGFYLPVIRKYSRACVSYRAHNIEHEIWTRKAMQETDLLKKIYLHILARRLRRFEIRLLNSYDTLIPITERDLDVLKRLGNEKPAFVAPFGIDLQKLPAPDSRSFYPSIFYIGALDWMPNQDGLLWFLKKVWPLLNVSYPGLEFHIAGRNAPDFLIREFAKPNVIFHGEVENAYEFMNKWSILVSPLFYGSGMRVKIVEGMALGKVVVTTPIGTEGINTTNGENILVADKACGFLVSLAKIIENRQYFNYISRKAISFAREHFDNHRIMQSLNEHLGTICTRTPVFQATIRDI